MLGLIGCVERCGFVQIKWGVKSDQKALTKQGVPVRVVTAPIEEADSNRGIVVFTTLCKFMCAMNWTCV